MRFIRIKPKADIEILNSITQRHSNVVFRKEFSRDIHYEGMQGINYCYTNRNHMGSGFSSATIVYDYGYKLNLKKSV